MKKPLMDEVLSGSDGLLISQAVQANQEPVPTAADRFERRR